MRLLILGPSYRRREGEGLTALERYDGVFFRVARKHLTSDVDVLVLTDDLRLVWGHEKLPYRPPIGKTWTAPRLRRGDVERARQQNEKTLDEVLGRGKYAEVFIVMGKQYLQALPDLSKYKTKITIAKGGPGPKAQQLKQWLRGE